MSPEASAAIADGTLAGRTRPVVWLLAAVPLLLLAALLVWLLRAGPAEFIRGTAPPVERLAITRVELAPGLIHVSVLNDGPDPVTIAQVIVDDAFWTFRAVPATALGRLGRARIEIPYPWVHGETHQVKLLTSSGLTFSHEIPVALETPRPTRHYFAMFALVGLYVGVIPVALGLFWYPLMRRASRGTMQFLLALTVGLLAYLLVDTTHDGLEAAALVPGAFQGPALFVFGALAAFIALDAISAWMQSRRQAQSAASGTGWTLAVLVAVGIGLHNFGEGLAIGSAFALGELALGTLLIVGFTLHNTTEGLAIVAPLARRQEPVGLGGLIQLGLIGGVPTILGAWLGAFTHSPLLAVFFLALGVGAIAQVTVQIVGHGGGAGGIAGYVRQRAVLAGLATGVAIMYVTGLFVG